MEGGVRVRGVTRSWKMVREERRALCSIQPTPQVCLPVREARATRVVEVAVVPGVHRQDVRRARADGGLNSDEAWQDVLRRFHGGALAAALHVERFVYSS